MIRARGILWTHARRWTGPRSRPLGPWRLRVRLGRAARAAAWRRVRDRGALALDRLAHLWWTSADAVDGGRWGHPSAGDAVRVRSAARPAHAATAAADPGPRAPGGALVFHPPGVIRIVTPAEP